MSRVLLLDVDARLAAQLPQEEAERARAAIAVDVETLPQGPWVPRRAVPSAPAFGLLLLDGLLVRELAVPGSSSVEMLGDGDVIRPWQEDVASFTTASYRCLTPVKLAALNGEAGVAICEWPALVSELMERSLRRSRSLAIQDAIKAAVGIEQRLVLLFWHLAERWGRRTGDGVEVPVDLTHAMIGALVGARRPSISGGLAALARAGRIERRPGGWLIRGTPPEPASSPGVTP